MANDTRVDFVVRAICKSYGLCDCEILSNCCIDTKLAEDILIAVDAYDAKLGIVRVLLEPNSDQILVGMKCALRGESPSITYKEMIRKGMR